MAVTTLTITMLPNSVANTVSVSIPSALQTFESTLQGSAADQAIRSIFKSGVFVDGTGRWWSAYQILSIVAS